MKALVPDFAIIPRLFNVQFFVLPTPRDDIYIWSGVRLFWTHTDLVEGIGKIRTELADGGFNVGEGTNDQANPRCLH